MNPLFVKHIVTPMRKNPTLGASVTTGGLCFLMYWYYNRSIRASLLRTQQNCRAITEESLQECRDLLKDAEATWTSDIRARDAQVRRLEIQNVEQTRSVARLESAMKMCLVQSD